MMGNKESNTLKCADILFFGAGKIGRYWLEYFKEFKVAPKGIIDNNRALCGSLCEGIRVYPPDSLENMSYDAIFITCGREEEVRRQLLSLGVAESKIVVGYHNFINYLLYNAVPDIFDLRQAAKTDSPLGGSKVLYDLQNGLVLGGVETWVYDLAKVLKAKGCQGVYLTTDAAGACVVDNTCPVEALYDGKLSGEKEKVELCLRKIVENLPCTIVCNFPQNIFWSACIAKRLYPDRVRIAAVQHSDDELYYEAYGLWSEYIDKYLAISSRMEEKLLASGMDRGRLCRLEWKAACEERMDRTWSGEGTDLRIGYAGRITTVSKRVDLLPVLAAKLRERGVRFRMDIAGTGEYMDILRQRIRDEGLQECIRLAGYMERKDIPLFWRGQDIMVSCSEREGHSISQSEAMAGGAVPVLTDVSGAADDVTDGYNGYIVGIGDMDALADRICRLHDDRNLLGRMGQNAHDTIWHRQAGLDLGAFWEGLLEEIWQS